MREIRLHGRGGQGAQVACQMLAAAFFRGGRQIQAFAAYGAERRGAPVTASVRVDTEPILLRCDIARADVALVLDATLLASIDPVSLAPGALLVVNASNIGAFNVNLLGGDDTLFATADGRVQYTRYGRDRKRVHVVPVETPGTN